MTLEFALRHRHPDGFALEATLVAVRKKPGRAVGILPDADEIEQLLRALADRRFFAARRLSSTSA